MWSLTRKTKATPTEPTRPAPGMRIYAVGDMHGRYDLFEKLSDFVETDFNGSAAKRPFTVFLGDIIDRGPGSAEILDALTGGRFPVPFLVLRGNHEQMLLDSFQSDQSLTTWLRNGGVATLRSYGAQVSEQDDFDTVRAAMTRVIPPDHISYMAAMPTSAVSGDYFFCHAGVRPDVPLDEQQDRDLLWIRKPFLESGRDFGRRVVHGHTPTMQPEILPNRINIDTGAYATGVLTCLVLEEELMQTVPIVHRLSGHAEA